MTPEFLPPPHLTLFDDSLHRPSWIVRQNYREGLYKVLEKANHHLVNTITKETKPNMVGGHPSPHITLISMYQCIYRHVKSSETCNTSLSLKNANRVKLAEMHIQR